ncbi:hypothetical protein LOTGIDRAFT_166483 [Lottia gigantea]|uniref:C2 domain-containing protein n=1 Tax=Lottia gigantea TaxID=225164 RepID=V4A2S2_LOTGI|nr:hypothetical protein LOTGIDRAFT_166483 [Lottia gigantea]ESO87601.1 hypothetical protein LOTGIDRAFT_166483 [Lottia gigantea]
MEIVESIRKSVTESIPDIQLEQISNFFQRNSHSFMNRVRASSRSRRDHETLRRTEFLRKYYSKTSFCKPQPTQTATPTILTLMPTVPRRKLSSTNSTISYIPSVASLDDGCFAEMSSSIQIHKDSISDYELNDNEIQITINHEQKRNFLNVTIHRVNVTSLPSDIEHIIARVYVTPGKLQKQNSKSIGVKKASRWEHEFTFKKLTIGQLEDCSIRFQIFTTKGFFKVPVRIGRVSVDLKDVNISDFRTTILKLERDI